MNDLDLPPRRTIPPEVRDRIRGVTDSGLVEPPRQTTRYRGPLAVAASVAVLAAGAVVLGQSVNGTPDDFRPGATPPASTTTTVPGETHEVEPFPELTGTAPNARTTEDLDRCGAAVEASSRANEYPPRTAWEPVYTVTRGDARVTAFREYGGKPGFCEVDATSATVSDPSAETMPLGIDMENLPTGDLYALYVSPTGLVAGVGQGMPGLRFGVSNNDPVNGGVAHRKSTPVFQDELFVVDVGGLANGSRIDVTVLDEHGGDVARGEWAYDPAKVRPTGATINDR